MSLSEPTTIPYFDMGVSAGFPSPANDYLESRIDLNSELIKHPSSTFYTRVSGDSMVDSGIYNGDLLIVDKSLPAQNNKVAVCFIDGEFTIKKIKIQNDVIWLVPANKLYNPIMVTVDNEFLIWGIVTYSIKSH